MKRFFFYLLLGIIIITILYFYNEQKQSDTIVIEDEMHIKMSGYYYYGYLDEREKLDSQLEEEYFYYMDNHFQDYLDNMFIITRDQKQIEEESITFFHSINGLNLYSIPSPGFRIQNGDYISFIARSPIKESYPAMIDKIDNVEVLQSRESNE